jgi:hypothetical protein
MPLTTTGRRVIVIAVVAAVVFTGVAAVLGLVLPDRGDTTNALWLFGFRTVKVDPTHPSHRTTLRSTAFGEVVGTAHTVYMYDAGSGELGTIDAGNNDFQRLGRVRTSFPVRQEPVAPSIAIGERQAWLVVGPGRIVRLPIGGSTAQSPTAAVSLPGKQLGATRIVAAATGAVAVYATQDNVRAVKLDNDGRTESAANLVGVAPSDIVAVVTSGDRVIVVTPTRGFSFEAARPTAVDVFDLRAAVPGGVATADANATQLWLVARDHADLVRVDPRSGTRRTTVRYLAGDRPFRQPTQVLVTAGEVWLLAPTRSEADRHDAQVLRVQPDTGRVLTRILAPSSLFIGGIARTGPAVAAH